MKKIQSIVGFGIYLSATSFLSVVCILISLVDLEAQDDSSELAVSTVNALTLRVFNLQDEWDKAESHQKANKKAELLEVMKKRKEILLELMKTHPKKVIEAALSETLLKRLPAEAMSLAERHSDITGAWEHITACDFEGRKAAEIYSVETADKKRVHLHFTSEKPELVTGSKVRVRGVSVADQMAVDSTVAGSLETLEAADITAPIVKKVAVILFNFRNNVVQPYSKEQVRTIMFSSVRSYYEETTFGKFTLEGKLNATGDVFGWYTIDYDSGAGTDYQAWATAARAAAAADGFNATGYTQIMHAFPQNPALSWAGWGLINGSYTWINGAFTVRTMGHELGHNFGLRHSNAYNCTNSSGQRVAISSSGTSVEYGDPFDIMGSSGVVAHQNAYQKGRLGYSSTAALTGVFDAGRVQDVTTDGIYNVAPIEFTATGPQALRIPRDVDSLGKVLKYLHVEFRQPFGFDNTSSIINSASKGVLVHLAPPLSSSTYPYLLDATPATTTFSDATLLPGNTMFDAEKRISITTLSVSPAGASVQIKFNVDPDTIAPSVPNGLSASVISTSQVNLSWAASTDTGGSGLAGYKIYRNGTQIGSATGTTYSNTGLTPSTSYSYTVAAFDGAGNVSAQSSAVTATTLSTDSDGDGLLDAWEVKYFGSISDPRALAELDVDGDGLSNLDEQTAGTSPIDSKSALKILSQSVNEILGFSITWQSVSNKTYVVESSSTLTNWSSNTFVYSTSNSTTWIDASATGDKKFYRIKIR
jgi:hypothetical protein